MTKNNTHENPTECEIVQGKKILIAWAQGGTHAHNIVACMLRNLAKSNKSYADLIYEKVIRAGY